MKSLFRRFAARSASPRRFVPDARHPVHVQIVGRQSIDLLTARDISTTGIGVYVPHLFEGCDIDSEVELVITLPQQRAFCARGQIRHRTGAGDGDSHFGVEITWLADEPRARLARHLASPMVQPVERKDTNPPRA